MWSSGVRLGLYGMVYCSSFRSSMQVALLHLLGYVPIDSIGMLLGVYGCGCLFYCAIHTMQATLRGKAMEFLLCLTGCIILAGLPPATIGWMKWHVAYMTGDNTIGSYSVKASLLLCWCLTTMLVCVYSLPLCVLHHRLCYWYRIALIQLGSGT